MKSTYTSRPSPPVAPPRGGIALVAVVALLAISNILASRVLPAWSYVPWNLAVALAVVVIALRRRSLAQLGFTRWRSGAHWGVGIAAVIAAGLLLAVALAPTHDLFEDRRVDDRWQLLAYHSLVRIPLGTVLLEELAFRAVLLALMTANRQKESARSGRFLLTEPRWSIGIVGASALFGLWHVLPAWEIGEVNAALADVFGEDAVGEGVAVALTVLGTFLAGIGLCLLRCWSGSVLAPIIVHTATNSGAYTLAWLVTK